jgi:hypothetical protein
MLKRSGSPGKSMLVFTEKHAVLNGLKDTGYAAIYDSSKVRHLLKGINMMELDVCKTQGMTSLTLSDDFAATVELILPSPSNLRWRTHS